MKTPVLVAWVYAVAFGLPLSVSGQATLAFNNLDQNAGVVRIALGPTGGASILLNQDLNFTLEAGPVGGVPQTLHVWLLSDGSAKGINVAPGRFKDPSDGVYAVPGVAPGGQVEVQITAWPGHSDTPVRGHETSLIRFVMPVGGAGAAPSRMRIPDFTVYNVPVPYRLSVLSIVRSNGIPQLSLTGRVGYGYALEYAPTFPTDPTNFWRSLMNQTNWVLTNSTQLLTDTSAVGTAQRFYRVGPYTIPPPPSLVWINPGTFLMGEAPQTRVTLTYGFWIGKYKVKQIEYQSMVDVNPSFFIGDPDLPVETLTWSDAMNYCGQLTEHERLAGRLPAGYAYRLPTEAEWEYAARAGTTTRFSYGDDPGYLSLTNYAWYSANSGNQTHPVGQKLPNSWGLYDMYGNVLEWCLDWYGNYPGGMVTDPKGPASGSWRVLRSGWYRSAGETCGSTSRGGMNPDNFDGPWGLRVVLAPVQP